MKQKPILLVLLMALALSMLVGFSDQPLEAVQSVLTTNATVTTASVESVTAITEVFGDGQKITAVAIEYDQAIDNASLSTSTFSVDGRTITDVYANTVAATADEGVDGKYVIIELSTDDDAASVTGSSMMGGPGDGPGTPPDGAAMDEQDTEASEDQQAASDTATEIEVSVAQVEDITTTAGDTYAADSEAMVNDNVINLVVDDFQQFEYTDPATGVTLNYNLYIPQDYDENKSYPLVLFMHDAGEVGGDITATLTQGLGAVIWATPEEQAKHESFVLAPQYDTVIANDESETTPEADATVNLINYLETQYSIDSNRLYTTGQSMGCMTSIDLLIRYPDMFAAALLVAGQWDASLVTPMANDNLWIIVSEGDTKAYPGMNAITAALEEEGATVSRATWDPESTPEEFDADVSEMLAQDANIKYAVLEGGNHAYTWQIAYTIEGVRDWLFTQSKADTTKDDAYVEALTFDNTLWNYDADNDVYWQIGVQYAATPETLDYETMGIYVPGAYMTTTDNGDGTYTAAINPEGTLNGYTAATAPIVVPVNTPGYSAQAAPTSYSYDSVASYLEAGFVYVEAGMRGRSNGYDDDGALIYSGGAPWGVTDLKAAIRSYRYNQDNLPGDTDRIFTFGISGGGAQSTLMGATGDSELYYPYLESIGAAMYDANGATISDAVNGTMAWCPITSLDYADEAYEWNMGQYASTGTRADDTWTSALSDDLAAAYADYLNNLGLTDEDGAILMLEASEDGIYTSGTYYDYLQAVVEESLNNFLIDTTFPYTETAGGFGGPGGMGGPPNNGIQRDEVDTSAAGAPPEGETAEAESTTYETVQDYIDALNADVDWVTYDAETNTAAITNIADFVAYGKTPSKSVPAFDDLDRAQGENELFGNDENNALHFDPVVADLLAENQETYATYDDWDASYIEAYATDLEAVDKLGNGIQDRQNMYNPMYYLLDYYDGYQTSTVAKHWRINTGIEQGDTASTVEVNLALALENYDGVEDVAFTTVWDQGHTEAERTGDSTDNFIAWVNETVAADAPAAASPTADATPAIVAATNAFLATLSDTEMATVSFNWTDTAQKQRWSNFPDGAFEHDGLMWGDMSETQQEAWLQVMQATLSAEGYNRVLAEWNGDDTLTGGGGQVHFGTAYYYIAIMGTPSETEPWQWQFGGHHITVNATIVGPNLALTPSFIGVEPIEYTDADGNTVQPLHNIESTAFELMDALDSTQQQTAVLGDSATDVVLGPGQDGKTIPFEGLPAAEMTADQQEIFRQLIGYYTDLANDEDAAARMAEIEETFDDTYFAWYGPTDGSPAYFRVTGPTLVIEYSPQPSRNSPQPYHVHGIYRDPTNDYGERYAQ